ncbi:hypothetical protein EI94DRAFT_1420076, partial [Lactarius quietus]
CSHCHALHWLAEKKSNSSLENPVFTDCCNNGKIDIPFLDALPNPMIPFFEEVNDRACEFKKNICLYNKALAFMSTGGSGGPLRVTLDRQGPPYYKIQGEIHHQLGPLVPNAGNVPVFSQLFVYDHSEALQYRTVSNPERN